MRSTRPTRCSATRKVVGRSRCTSAAAPSKFNPSLSASEHNETSYFTELLEPLDLAGAVVTFDALHTVRANLNWLAGEKKGHYIAVVKKNQPSLHAQIKNLPWRQIPAAAPQRDRGHGREEHRTLKAATIAAGLCFPYAMQALRVTRRIRPLPGGKWRTVTTYAVTSLTVGQATPAQLAGWIRGHWRIEALHHIHSPGVPSLSHDVAPDARRRALAACPDGCSARCRC